MERPESKCYGESLEFPRGRGGGGVPIPKSKGQNSDKKIWFDGEKTRTQVHDLNHVSENLLPY